MGHYFTASPVLREIVTERDEREIVGIDVHGSSTISAHQRTSISLTAAWCTPRACDFRCTLAAVPSAALGHWNTLAQDALDRSRRLIGLSAERDGGDDTLRFR